MEDEFSWTSNEIAQAQRSDPGINPVIARMEEGKPKPSSHELSSLSLIPFAIWAKHRLVELLQLEVSKKFKPRVVLPEPLEKLVLQRLHDGLESPCSSQNTAQSPSYILAAWPCPNCQRPCGCLFAMCRVQSSWKNTQSAASPHPFVLPFSVTSH